MSHTKSQLASHEPLLLAFVSFNIFQYFQWKFQEAKENVTDYQRHSQAHEDTTSGHTCYLGAIGKLAQQLNSPDLFPSLSKRKNKLTITNLIFFRNLAFLQL